MGSKDNAASGGREGPLALLPVVCLVVLAGALSLKTVHSPDLWWHLASGRWMVEHRSLLDRDVLTFSSPGIPWVNRTWLSAVVLYLSWRSLGLTGICLIPFVLVTACFTLFAIVFRAARRPVAFALLGLLVLVVAHTRFLERPSLFSDILAPVVILLWLRLRDGRGGAGTLLALALIQVLWTHLHGGFVLGILVAFIFLAGALLRKSRLRAGAALVAAAGVAAALLTPWRADLIRSLTGFVTRLAPALVGSARVAVPEVARDAGGAAATQNIVVEWLPTFSGQGLSILGPIVPFVFALYGLAAFLIVRIWRSGRLRARLEEVLILVAFAVLGAVSIRFPATFALAAFPALWTLWNEVAPAGGAAGRPARRAKARRGAGARAPALAVSALLLLLTGLVVSNVYWKYYDSPSWFGVGLRPLLFPDRLADWMDQNHLDGRFFNTYDAGGYLAWRRPGTKIFTDSRVVSDEVYRDYVHGMSGAAGWRDLVARYHFDGALMRRGGGGVEEGLYRHLQKDPDWVLAYRDDIWAFFLTRGYLAAHGGGG